jgi:hypothetical protein
VVEDKEGRVSGGREPGMGGGMWGSDEEGRDCASPKHIQSGPSQPQNASDGREYAEIKKMECVNRAHA